MTIDMGGWAFRMSTWRAGDRPPNQRRTHCVLTAWCSCGTDLQLQLLLLLKAPNTHRMPGSCHPCNPPLEPEQALGAAFAVVVVVA